MAIPNGVIMICKGVPISNDYKHALWFANDTAMFTYFESKVVKTYSKYNFIKERNSIKVEATLGEALSWNYMYFQHNGVGGNKIYFAFITHVEYINEATVELFYEIDVLTTYMWSYTLKQCFVERQHSETDAIGDNVLDEGLDIGDPYIMKQKNVDMQDLCMLMLSSINPNNGARVYTKNINNVVSGLWVFAVNPQQIPMFDALLQELDSDKIDGSSDAILSMWMYPKKLVQLAENESWDDTTNIAKRVDRVKEFDVEVDRGEAMIGQQMVVNNKLFTYPYNYIYVSNNAGGAATYKYEQFALTPTCRFRLVGALSPEATVKMYPVNYRQAILNYEEGLSLGGYPTCAWSQDAYKLWLANNQNQLNVAGASAALTIAGGVAAMGASIFTGGLTGVAGAGAIAGGVGTIANMIAQKRDMQVQPPHAKGGFSSNVNVAAQFQTFTIQQRCMQPKYIKIVDDFFTRFGYLCKEIKIPNKHARKSFTYVKTVDCQIAGNINHEHMQKIESIFDTGVTFWANPAVVGDYTVDNSCL